LQTYHEKSWLEPLQRQSRRQRQRRPPDKKKQSAAINSKAAAATSLDGRIGLARNGNVAEARRVVI